ncbi:MAG: hypothetical protein KC423_20925 [Anaerolineales bacterium]|nr:hypothetical protein [Anaerolineales bacterium]
MDTNQLLQRLRLLESAVVYDSPPPAGTMPFTYQPGTIPVLLSAPHGAAHRRNGRLKVEDEYTAAFVRLVAAETGSHVIYTRYQSDTDPNWDRQTPYKEQLRQIIREHQIAFVLDIHGMSNRHKIGLAVGTINGRSCPRHESCIVRVLENGRFKQTTQDQATLFPQLQADHFVLNHSRFTGGVKNHTVTRFVSQELNVPAAQLEFCSSLRVVEREWMEAGHKWPRLFQGDPNGIRHAVTTLISLVDQLKQ